MNHPNIILITADGLRWDSLGCHGNPDVKTPNIDALAAHGVSFSQAISALAGFSAGGHAFLTGAHAAPFRPDESDIATAPPLDFHLPQGLAEAGYGTAAIGALDLPVAEARAAFGHVEYVGSGEGEDDYSAWLRSEGVGPDDLSGALLREAWHPTTWTGDQATRYVRTAREPFFLWVSLPRPRFPLDPPVPWKHLYRPSRLQWLAGANTDDLATGPEGAESDLRRRLAAWYGSISHVDRQVGRLLATLTARGRTNNLIALTAGRGACLGYRGLVESALPPEPVLRVPLILGGAGVARRGGVEPGLVTLGDLVPTFGELAQVSLAVAPGGVSFAAHLREEGVPHRRTVALGGPDYHGIRSVRYKWVQGPEPDQACMYDLQADPEERHNLHGQRPSAAIGRMLLAAQGQGVAESTP